MSHSLNIGVRYGQLLSALEFARQFLARVGANSDLISEFDRASIANILCVVDGVESRAWKLFEEDPKLDEKERK